MNKLLKYYEEIAEKWKQYKGKGCVYCDRPLDYADLICVIIKKVLLKNKDNKILIVINNYETRKCISDKLDKNNINKNNINILSIDYIKTNYKYNYDLLIIANINSYTLKFKYLCDNIKFSLMIMTLHNIYDYDINKIYETFPLINFNINIEEANKIILTSPVNEYHIGVDLSEEDKKEYDKQSNYINNIMTIIDTPNNIKYIKYGDNKLNLSAAEVRYNIAKANGWSEELDMSIEFNRQIDENYNPNALLDKVNNLVEIVNKRKLLCSDNINKINKILEIINTEENRNKKIVIISKRGEFASIITKHLNNNNISCEDYHDCIEDSNVLDDNENVILVKSGPNKGKPKLFKAKAISSLNLKAYLSGDIQVLSTKNSSLNGLKLRADMVIITSPRCENIYDIKCRTSSFEFSSTPNIVYLLYSKDTIEEKQSINRNKLGFIKTINEEKNIEYNENTGEVIL